MLLTKAYRNLGVMEVGDGRFAEAEGLFKRAILIDSTHPASYVHLGNLYVRQKKGSAILVML